jgi:uncharacterized membrane protein YbhN (UPF0104 family)
VDSTDSQPDAISTHRAARTEQGEQQVSASNPRGEARSARIRSLIGRFAPVARPAFALLIFLAIGYAIVSEWQGVRSALLTLDWPSVVLSFFAAFAGTVASLMAWRALLADEGHPLPVLVAGRIFFVGQLGKYLPGSVWSIVMQMELAKSAGVQRGRAFTTSLAWVGLSLSTALCMGVLGFPVLASAHEGQVWVLVAMLPFALVASAPPVLTRLVNLVLRVMRKGPLPKALSWRGVLTACAWLAATWAPPGSTGSPAASEASPWRWQLA